MLWEVGLICHYFPGAGSPSQYLGFDRVFADTICFDVDVTIAKFALQTEARMEAEEKHGKGYRKKYQTMAEVLGVTEDEWAGGFDEQELKETARDFRKDFNRAMAESGGTLDIDAWLKAYEADDDE